MRDAVVSQFGESWAVVITDSDGVSFDFRFSEIERLKRTETTAYVEVIVKAPDLFERYAGRLNLASNGNRKDLASILRGIMGDKRSYDAIISQAIVALFDKLDKIKKAQSFVEIDPEVNDESMMLFYPFITNNSANLIFGNGESTKSYITMRLMISLVAHIPFLGKIPYRKCKVLFLDYEDRAGKFADRISRILSGMENAPSLEDMANLHYFKAKGIPLPDLVPALKRELERTGCDVLVIDSAAYASGAEIERADAAIRLFNALDDLGVTSLMIAHVTKGSVEDEKGQRFAMGSIYFHNGPRNTWNVVKLGEENDEEPVKKVCMFHRKSNDGPRHPMIPLEVDFSKKGVVSFRIGKVDDWEDKQHLTDRIKNLLKSGMMGRKAIEDAFRDEKKNSVKGALKRLVERGEILLMGGQGGEYLLKR